MAVKKFYYWLHRNTSLTSEAGEYSAGYWQNIVRKNAINLCGLCQGKVLEVGCGEGLFLEKLAKARPGLSIYGADIRLDILKKARQRLTEHNIKNTVLAVTDIGALPFKDNSFDVVVCVNVFFNLPAAEMVRRGLKEISRVCKNSQKLIFDVRNSRNPLLHIKYKLAKYYDETVKNLPLKTYKIEEISKYLDECGFDITRKIFAGFPGNAFSPLIIVEARKR